MSNKHTPDQDSPEAATAVAEPPAAEAAAEGQSFADKVGQKRQPAPDPFGIATDSLAGVRLFQSKQDNQMALKFGDGSTATKPSQAVIDTVKEAGFRWNPADRIWARAGVSRADQIEAERLYQTVRQMIRDEKGLGENKEVPF